MSEVLSERGEKSQQAAQEIKLSEAREKKLLDLLSRFPQAKSAILPALYLAQEEFGYLTERGILWVSARLALPPAHVAQVASFYSMFQRKPVGRYHLQFCRTLCCALAGAEDLVAVCKKHLGLSASHELSKDGMWSYQEVECLGSCGTAPVVQINDTLFERMTATKLIALLERIAEEQPNLSYSTVSEKLGPGFSDLPKSLIRED